MLKAHPHLTKTLLVALVLGLAPAVAFAAECPININGTSYASPYSSPIALPRCSGTIAQWSVCELCLISNADYTDQTAYKNSYLPPPSIGLEPVAKFINGSQAVSVHGFFEKLSGTKAVFRVRFTPPIQGSWSVTATSSDAGLRLPVAQTFTAGLPGTRGFLRRDTTYQEKLRFDNGAYHFLWGQTYYQFVDNVVKGVVDWKASINNSSAYGMQKVRMLVSPFTVFEDGSIVGETVSQPFNQNNVAGDHTKLNSVHWRKLDEIVQYLHSKSMTADVILFSDNLSSFAQPIGTSASKASDQRYVRYALARLASFPNVIWCLANEWNAKPPYAPYQNEKPYWDAIGNIVRTEDPWMIGANSRLRALSIHQRPGDEFSFFPSSWPVHAIVQFRKTTTYPDGDQWGNHSIQKNLGRGLPVVNDEYGYIGQIGLEKHRRASWGIAVAGGFGSTGDATEKDENGATVLAKDQPVFSGAWKDQPAYGDIQRMVTFFNTKVTNWWKMSRDNSVVTAGNRVYAFSQPGVRYVVYAAVGGTVKLNLPAGNYAVYQYNPRSGQETLLYTNVMGGVRSFTLPDTNDWVLRFN